MQGREGEIKALLLHSQLKTNQLIAKMIDAGWYFCPNEESEDFVTCAYCKLSLDGWEPKDDPL